MRLLPILSMAGVVACEQSDSASDVTQQTSLASDVSIVDTTFFAIIIDDSAQFPTHRADGGDPCSTSSIDAHGADIDAVSVSSDGDGERFATAASYRPGTACTIDPKYGDVDQVKGPRDGELLANFLSLGGGSVTVTFGEAPLAILEGFVVTVYEIGDAFCGTNPSCVGDEAYSVYLASDLDCTKDSGDCAVVLISDTAEGEAEFEVPAF